MSAEEIAAKLWNLCNVLRDDGVTYHQYLNELTFILFIKLSEVKGFEEQLPEEYRWSTLKHIKDNKELFDTYRELLATISNKSENTNIKEIFTNASTTLRNPVNLRTLVSAIDQLDWYEEHDRDVMGDIYEDLLERNATEKKSGAGQYFTPRPLINVMVELMAPRLGERWNDPACGTFGFPISIDHYLKERYDYPFSAGEKERKFQETDALSGVELVQDAHRLALMNAKLHGLDSTIFLNDTLTEFGKTLRDFHGVLANPPFGTKKGGERPSRDDFTFPTSNKQLNFLQHIYRSLHKRGGARAAVVLPDNVLFEDGDGARIRRDLMDKCRLHTILRLPTGIFYAQGVKTNVLFFERGTTETGNTDKVWYYDMRTNMPSYGKRTPFTRAAFEDFIKAYTGGMGEAEVQDNYDGIVDQTAREAIKDERWQCITREQIAAKNDSLDLGLIADSSLGNGDEQTEPIDLVREAAEELKSMLDELNAIMKELE
ncbi:type I restriction-modification system subunit M [Mangrovibacterium diazotrophicum]|uniref:site-specific DNA-methyltransferase (adenine-specific) n=1 Tax=Mangrovibacterium diazotrophicum TaxID=1261403 RepID=A0A419W4N8_9BACT|nr:type I restriction-modification system subunit M [Mangrovibacterium diazotrophicum]RKD90428.1 type I restriction enzyme M protein [Mangrovibacterium diazotrophicum]